MTEGQQTINISEEGKIESAGGAAAALSSIPSRVVRTLEGDIASAMKEKKGSVVSIAIAEQKKREKEFHFEGAETGKNSFFVFASVVALAGGIVLFGFMFFERQNANQEPQEQKTPSIVFAEKEKAIEMAKASRSKIISEVSKETNQSTLKLNTIEQIRFMEISGDIKTELNVNGLISAMGTHMPGILERSLSPEFMLGIHSWDGNQAFLVIKTDFYENAFLGLLRWERDMAGDLLPLFGKTISDENRYLLEKDFSDIVIKNRDARVLYDNNGAVSIIYAIPDKKTIVISSHEDTLSEVIDRLSAAGKNQAR
ncbi:MAG: hypothetical protein AAB355_02375 [Patescibacteria group bacterium]